MKKIFINEKIDIMYSVIGILLYIILMLVFKLTGLNQSPLNPFFSLFAWAAIILPTTFRRRKRIKKIEQLRKILEISIEEVRAIADIGRYDLSDWKWDKAYIPQRKLYRLEDVLEKKYIERYGQSFALKR